MGTADISWVTAAWSMLATACLVLGMVQGMVWVRQRDTWASLWFAILAVSTAGMAVCELLMMRAATPEAYALIIRWYHVPIWAAFVSLVGFVQCHMASKKAWLAWLAVGIRTISLIINFLGPSNLNYRKITSLDPVAFLGERVTTVTGVPNGWMVLGQLSLLLLIGLIADATVTAWKGGERRRALSTGGSLLLFVGLGTAQAILVYWGFIKAPMMGSPYFLGIVVAMGVELSLDLLRSAELARQLKTKQMELRASEDRLSLAAEAAGAGMWSLDARTGTFWTTPKALDMFGLAPGTELNLERFLELVHPEDRQRVQQKIQEALESGESVAAEYRAVLGRGNVHWFVSRGRSVRENGKGRSVMGVTVDISQRKAMEDEAIRQRADLAHLSRVASLSELSGSLAHELNQPLAIILSNAQAAQRLLAQEPPDLVEVRDILTDIVGADRRAGEVIKRLRALLKRGEPSRVPLQMNDVIMEVVELTRSDLIQRGVSLTLHCQQDLPLITGDRVPLEQVMLNLLVNACEAMSANPPGDRVVTISSRAGDGVVEVFVHDTGCGLPMNPERIFDAFYTTKPNGLGMGLSICRTIVKAHDGRLWAEPNGDRGTTLHLSLPIAGMGL